MKQLTILLLIISLFSTACRTFQEPPTPTVTSTPVPVVLEPSPTPTDEPSATPSPIPSPTPTPTPKVIQLVSRANDGQLGNGASNAPSISANGRWMVFTSQANNLVPQANHDCKSPGQSVSCADIFLYDHQADTLTRVSRASDGTPANGGSLSPVVSNDGQWIAFVSQADNLVAGDTNGVSDIFLHHVTAGLTRRISTAQDGTPGNGRSFAPSMSVDGRFISFASEADNLVFGDTNEVTDMFVYDHQTGDISRVSLTPEGQQTQQSSWPLGMSADGQQIIFGAGGRLDDPLDRQAGGIFIHHRATGNSQQAVVDESGLGILAASLSADGRWLAYQQFVGHWDIFILDLETGNRQQISQATDGRPANFDSFSPVISADGQRVVFSSRASNLATNDTNNAEDIFLHDRQTGRTSLISHNEAGQIGNEVSQSPTISGDGQWVLFTSQADNLVADDTNNQQDVFIRSTETIDEAASLLTLPDLELTQFEVVTTTIGFEILDLAIRPDAEQVAVTGWSGAGIYSLPDMSRELFLFGDSYLSVTWAPDNYRLATAGLNGEVPVWASTTGGKLNLLGVRNKDKVTAWDPRTDWSSDGEFVVSNSVDELIYVWRVVSATTEILLNEDGAGQVDGLAWSPSGRYLAVSDADAVRLWDVNTLQSRVILPREPYEINDLAWSANGQRLAFGSERLADGQGLVHVWDMAGSLAVLEGPPQAVNSVTWSPDGILASGGSDGVWLWDVATGQYTILDQPGTVTSLDWSAEGQYLLAGTADGTIYMWQ